MTDNPDAVLVETFPKDREFIAVSMPREAEDAITLVISRHLDEFDEALSPFGLTHKDMLMPDWRRPLRKADILRFLADE